MLGKTERQAVMHTGLTSDALVPQGYPIRRIKPMVERGPGRAVLRLRSDIRSDIRPDIRRKGWASIPPEHLLMALF